MSKIVVIGAGAMGTAFATPCLDNNHDVNIIGTHLENNFIDLLYGSDELRDNIKDGLTNEEIRATWKKDLDAFKLVREKYLLYSDF